MMSPICHTTYLTTWIGDINQLPFSMLLAIYGHTSFQRNLSYIKPNLWNICEHDSYIISIKEIVSE